MLVECRARRGKRDIRVGRKDTDIGSKSEVYGKLYHFLPRPELLPEGIDPAVHVCEVTDERAIERFVVGIPEQYNEVGKPPRIKFEQPRAETSGQIPITTEMVDDEQLGTPDPSQRVDPMAKAKELHQKWLDDMLARPIKGIGQELHRFNSAELGELRDEEARAKKPRATLIAALNEAIEDANEREEGGPTMPPDDPQDISVE
jgi:hypothetical protein